MRHCRYCGNTGHNRRTCPSRSPESKQVDNDYHKRYRSRNRTCRYCRGSNHDRRKCVSLETDRANWITENAAFRKRFLEDAKKAGWGVGALVKMQYYGDEPMFYLITKINWDAIVPDNRYAYAMTVMRIGDDGITDNFNAPRYFGVDNTADREYYMKNNDIEIENPVAVNTIENSIPANWLSGVCAKNYMPHNLR